MSISRETIEVSGIRVEVVRKPIKNLHLSVYPPEGRVRVSAPLRLDDEAVRLAVTSRLGWLRRKRKLFLDQPRQSQREMVSGESHYFLGRRYRLNVTERNGPNRVTLNGTSELTMQLRPGTDRDRREQLLNAWYRRRMKELVPDLIAKWQPIIGVEVADWGIKKMKTRWGSCNTGQPRLAQPRACQEIPKLHRIRPGTRDGAPPGTQSFRALQSANEQVPSTMAVVQGRAEPGAPFL